MSAEKSRSRAAAGLGTPGLAREMSGGLGSALKSHNNSPDRPSRNSFAG